MIKLHFTKRWYCGSITFQKNMLQEMKVLENQYLYIFSINAEQKCTSAVAI